MEAEGVGEEIGLGEKLRNAGEYEWTIDGHWRSPSSAKTRNGMVGEGVGMATIDGCE